MGAAGLLDADFFVEVYAWCRLGNGAEGIQSHHPAGEIIRSCWLYWVPHRICLWRFSILPRAVPAQLKQRAGLLIAMFLAGSVGTFQNLARQQREKKKNEKKKKKWRDLQAFYREEFQRETQLLAPREFLMMTFAGLARGQSSSRAIFSILPGSVVAFSNFLLGAVDFLYSTAPGQSGYLLDSSAVAQWPKKRPCVQQIFMYQGAPSTIFFFRFFCRAGAEGSVRAVLVAGRGRQQVLLASFFFSLQEPIVIERLVSVLAFLTRAGAFSGLHVNRARGSRAFRARKGHKQPIDENVVERQNLRPSVAVEGYGLSGRRVVEASTAHA